MESPPNCAVQELRVVRRSDGYDSARKSIYLEKDGAHDTLDLSGLVGVAAFLPDVALLGESARDVERCPEDDRVEGGEAVRVEMTLAVLRDRTDPTGLRFPVPCSK